jgi:hypothetical protein
LNLYSRMAGGEVPMVVTAQTEDEATEPRNLQSAAGK